MRVQRLVRYHKGIESGLIHVDAKPEVVFETPVSAVIDGHSGMGQLLGHYAMELAIEKAKKSGVGIVSVRNSIHLKSKVFIKIYIFFIVCFQRYHHVVFLRICDRFI